MRQIPSERFLALREPTLWPLALLTAEPVDRIMMEEMLAELLEKGLYGTLAIGYSVAGWRLNDDDLDWFKKEFQRMQESFRESPVFKWVAEDLTEKVERELEQKYEQKLLEERKQAEAKLSAERKQMLEERKQMLATFQKTVIALVSERFPTLQRFAKTQVRGVKEPELHQTMLDLARAREADEAENVLFALSEKEEDEDEFDLPHGGRVGTSFSD